MYELIESDEFQKWRDRLRDRVAQLKIRARIARAEMGNFGDWKTESGDIRAMRIDYGPGYRLYYIIRKNIIVFLLCGGDKHTQQADIKRAIEIAKGV